MKIMLQHRALVAVTVSGCASGSLPDGVSGTVVTSVETVLGTVSQEAEVC